ncbi:MAG: hypothetical protein E7166_05600 [Firmicutes bacterium]|nr:hypothetical protein [Bacillota bacterium]
MKNISNLLWGFVLIIIGIIFGLNSLEITSINLFFDGWWTLFIIVPCFINLFKEKDKTGDIICLIIGIAFFLGCQNMIRFEFIWKLIVPFILVSLGISLVFKDTITINLKEQIKRLNKANKNEYCSTFGVQNLDFSNEKFEGCSINSIFGVTKCDLRDANITEDVVINASAVFGGITIKIPSDFNVKISSTPIFGGVSDSRRKKNKNAKITIYIKATCLFGGIEIK